MHGVDLRFDATDHLHRATVCDVTDEDSLAPLVSGIAEECGRIDGLVNNAGISLEGSDPQSRDDFLQTLSVNTLAPFRLGWLAAQAMERPGGLDREHHEPRRPPGLPARTPPTRRRRRR